MQIIHINRKLNAKKSVSDSTVYTINLKNRTFHPHAVGEIQYTSPMLSHHTTFPGHPVKGGRLPALTCMMICVGSILIKANICHKKSGAKCIFCTFAPERTTTCFIRGMKRNIAQSLGSYGWGRTQGVSSSLNFLPSCVSGVRTSGMDSTRLE